MRVHVHRIERQKTMHRPSWLSHQKPDARGESLQTHVPPGEQRRVAMGYAWNIVHGLQKPMKTLATIDRAVSVGGAEACAAEKPGAAELCLESERFWRVGLLRCLRGPLAIICGQHGPPGGTCVRP